MWAQFPHLWNGTDTIYHAGLPQPCLELMLNNVGKCTYKQRLWEKRKPCHLLLQKRGEATVNNDQARCVLSIRDSVTLMSCEFQSILAWSSRNIRLHFWMQLPSKHGAWDGSDSLQQAQDLLSEDVDLLLISWLDPHSGQQYFLSV